MAKFIVRVELHDAGYDDPVYQTLHQSMEKAGFKRHLTADDGVSYQLLTAEYHAVGDYPIKTVIEAAKKAAKTTDKLFSVFVAEYTNAMWNNLKHVKPLRYP